MVPDKKLFRAPDSPYLVKDGRKFAVASAPTEPPSDTQDLAPYGKGLKKITKDLQVLQPILYAQGRYAVLVIFQAMDAAGKDSTVRAVMTGINPAGCDVYSFKKPSGRELAHDYLWRTYRCLPERGYIGIFNRSYYEEVLVVRVHPELLAHQNLPPHDNLDALWQERFESICNMEKHLALNGTVILKFWLNVSKMEQKKRLLRRINRKDKHWKWSFSDLQEREFWQDYMAAYEEMVNKTSRPWAPWYVVPADDKPFMRYCVAGVIRDTLQSLNLEYPAVDESMGRHLVKARKQLLAR